jgi:hypothetical protein
MKCLAPWNSIDVNTSGVIKPCCKFLNQKYPETFNIQTNTLNEYINSDFLNGVKQQLLDNKWPEGCERCRVDEEAGIDSKRQLDYERWKDHYDNYQESDGFIIASLAFGNTCNLSCIMCSPRASSKWRVEWKEIYNEDVRSADRAVNDDFIKTFIKTSPNLVHFDVRGGEPFLSQPDKQKELLKYYVDTNQAKDITLHYTTNAQQFPDDEFWELWSHFKELDMQLSIDGIGAHFEYIRYPGNWDILTDIVAKFVDYEQRIPNLRLSVSHTVSAYNIFYLPEFFNWCASVGLPKPYTGKVHRPDWQRPEIVCCKTLVDKLNNSKVAEIQSWATLITNNKLNLIDKFIEQTNVHDKYRGLSFQETFPELQTLIEEINNDN